METEDKDPVPSEEAKSDAHAVPDLVVPTSPPKVTSSASTPLGAHVDRYGFLIIEKARPNAATIPVKVETPEQRRLRIQEEVFNLEKWQDLLSKWEKPGASRPDAKLKEYCREGVPEMLRAKVWMKVCGADKLKEARPNLYKELLTGTAEEPDKVISRDIDRTFPSHSLFKEKGGPGQRMLFNVLHAYAVHNPVIGYCQGMGFITAMFLSYMPEDDAFYLLLKVVEDEPYKLDGLFQYDMAKSRVMIKVFDSLLPKYYKQLAAHLKDKGIDPSMYMTGWIIPLFTSSFPFELCVRFWDIFLCEGWKMTFRLLLAIMQREKKTLKKMPFDEMLMYLRDTPYRVGSDAGALIKEAIAIDVTTKQIQKAVAEKEKEVQAEIDAQNERKEERRKKKEG